MTASLESIRFSVHRSLHRVTGANRCRFSYERTDERTNEEITYVANKTFRSDTCAHVQKFRFVRVGQTRPLTRRELGVSA